MKFKKRMVIMLSAIIVLSLVYNFYTLDFKKVEKNMIVKNVPTEYKDIFKEASKFFPEYKDLDISFKKNNSKKNTFQSRPSFIGLLAGKKYYYIYKSYDMEMKGLFDSFPKDAQIGVVIHELSHITDYEKMNFFEIVKFGFEYHFSAAFVKKIENRTDLRAYTKSPEHLCAWKIARKKCDISKKHTQNYCNSSDKTNEYWKRQKKYYLDPVGYCEIYEGENKKTR